MFKTLYFSLQNVCNLSIYTTVNLFQIFGLSSCNSFSSFSENNTQNLSSGKFVKPKRTFRKIHYYYSLYIYIYIYIYKWFFWIIQFWLNTFNTGWIRGSMSYSVNMIRPLVYLSKEILNLTTSSGLFLIPLVSFYTAYEFVNLLFFIKNTYEFVDLSFFIKNKFL